MRWPDGVKYPALMDPPWTATGNMATGRNYHKSAVIRTATGSERVLITGGRSAVSTYESSCELYNPSTGTFGSTGPMPTKKWSHTATSLSGDPP